MNSGLHIWTWILWLVGVLVAISLTRNPIYLILILVCLLITHASIQHGQDQRKFPFPLIRFGLLVILLSALFNMLTAHYGEMVLFSLPLNLPLLGGNYTLEGLIYGAINGLVLFAILVAFIILVTALPVSRLVRLIPRVYYPLAVITSIAITFVPNTLRQFQQVRDAQAIRGHRMRGLRDWLPLLMPLLVGGLEHALQLAEAMSARGFAAGTRSNQRIWPRAVLLAGLLLLIAGWLFSLTEELAVWGWGGLLVGACAMSATLWYESHLVQHTTYLEEHWHWQDVFVWGGVLLLFVTYFVPMKWVDRSSLLYPVYPRFTLPGFDPWIGAALLLILLPAWLAGSGNT